MARSLDGGAGVWLDDPVHLPWRGGFVRAHLCISSVDPRPAGPYLLVHGERGARLARPRVALRLRRPGEREPVRARPVREAQAVEPGSAAARGIRGRVCRPRRTRYE